MKRIGIYVQNVIQWYTIKPLVSFLTLKKYPVDIIVFDPDDDSGGYHKIAKSLIETIKKDHSTPKTKPSNNNYHICLAPYSNMITVPCKYKLGYCYGAATTKPSLTLQPEFKENFHGMFLHDTYGAELFSIYARTYIVPYLYLKPFSHKKISHKPVILYLPTYHDKNSIEVATSLKELKNDYHIITKAHHGTDFLDSEKEVLEILKSTADEIYDSTQYIVPLFEKSDIVLSDNSGAVMDALYAKIPVAIATKEINNGFKGIDTLQYQLVKQKIIPYTKNLSSANIKEVIEKGLSKSSRTIQAKASDKIFPNKDGGVMDWFKILKRYLDDEIDQNYCIIHDYLLAKKHEEINSLITNNNNLINENHTLKTELKQIKAKLEVYENSRAHKLVETMLKFKR